MASSALEEKINKIRQQNEEIRRRYEEVEEDKKNAAKLNALVQMVPSKDWPERKEPPEFSNPPKAKPKSTKEKHEYIPQPHSGEGKKIHTFAQGEGPPPDPKYNFLADSEREEPSVEYMKDSIGNKSHHKLSRGNCRRKPGGRESSQKDNKPNKGNYRDESQPGYDAWRAERNRIDEDRISRQRTAEGNWRREWDNDKVHIIDDVVKQVSRPTLGDFAKKDHKDSDRRYHANNNEHVNYTRGGYRSHRGSSKNFYVSPTSEERTVVATEKSIKVTVNQNNVTKGPVMSVKVNSPSIAGTGRVGPRQRTRVTYSHSDVDAPPSEGERFFRQKSFEDKSKGIFSNNQKFSNLKRSHSQRKKENETKYSLHQRKDNDGTAYKHCETEFRSYVQKDPQKSNSIKSPRPTRGNTNITKHDSSNMNVSQKRETQEYSIASDEIKLENNVTTENNETLQETKCEETDASSVENGQMNITNENQIVIEKSSTKTTEETMISVSGTDNSEYIAKDDTNENYFEKKNECSFVNNASENLQENSNMSSETLAPDNVQSNEELVPNESKEVSKNVVKEEDHEDNQQSLEQVTKQIVNNDCDNIEDKVTVQQNTEEVTDNFVSSLEDKTHSVIENNNPSVCNNEVVKEEVLNDEKEPDDCKELSDVNSKNIVNTESTLSHVNENTVEKIEEIRDEKEDKEEKNEENDKNIAIKNSTDSQ
ncbi:PREDICTED: uncharacterized protein LOC108571564 isoform X2 [Habropoda laboriosa]|uniref:uncharacterized protein LOC108571564 isoform X2 n=1 Tax=Habropoda laboriosa TaxID=597456 RepID=UPI00083E5D0F|nr:PREDICTED: uncharacterized protein LOC108571564 isoform X2 [Habropoda laboriosa]